MVKVDPNMGSKVSHVQITTGYILSSFFLIPFRNSLGSIFPILGVGWTLSFEMFFYLLIACSIFLGMNKAKFLTAAIIPLAIVGIFYNDSWPAVLSLTRPLLLEFLAGVFLAQAVRRGLEVNPYACSFMFLAGSIGIWQNYAHGLSSVLIVVAVVMLENHLRVPSWALVIGESSYSIYLVHYLIVQAICRVVIWQASNRMSEISCIYLCISASLLAGIIVHYVLELPITSALNRGFRNLFRSDRLVGLPTD
jgi:exopolysaccharide production protein ExoZ